MDACLTAERGDGVPPPKDHHRKMLSVEPDLAEAISELRFEMKLRSEADLYRLLLRRGYETVRAEREAAAPAKPTKRRRPHG